MSRRDHRRRIGPPEPVPGLLTFEAGSRRAMPLFWAEAPEVAEAETTRAPIEPAIDEAARKVRADGLEVGVLGGVSLRRVRRAERPDQHR